MTTEKGRAIHKQAIADRELQIARTEAMNALILALGKLETAIECYKRARVHNLAIVQIKDDLNEEIHAIWKDDDNR